MLTGAPPAVEPVYIGPAGEPRLTLGWQVISWMLDWLQQPDGPDAGGMWRPTFEQARFLRWWYAVDDRGRFIYRRGTLRRMKGWGKDPLAAAIAAVELCGPCRVARLDPVADGGVVGEPHPAPWVQVAAVSKDQTRNTMTLFPRLFSKAAVAEYGLDIGKEIIYTASGGRIEAVTSSPRALEGGRPTLVIANETHHWLANNDGHEMAKAIARNLAKSRDGSARMLEITNAHEPGEDSVAERNWEAWQDIVSGRSKATGVLYDSLEAPPDTVLADRESLRAGLLAARGDSVWLDVDRLIEEIYDPATPPSMSRRFYLNQIVAADDAWASPQDVDACAKPDVVVDDGEAIVLFFDGGISDDSTGLVGCRISDGHLFVLGCWEKPLGLAGQEWRVDRVDVDRVVRQVFDRYRVVAFFADVAGWETYVDQWGQEFGDRLVIDATGGRSRHPVAWDMRAHVPEFTKAAEWFEAELRDHAISHDGDARLRQHLLNAKRAPNRWGVSIRKEHRESARKIDLAVCAVGARMVRRLVVASPSWVKQGSGKRAGRVVGWG